ncbi:HmuY family protein [Sinimarinibacterium thermocellulolyticum]|uniref:HmuY family protein n=1 Tax=Sinimarinibacterium thermocellulolyticum TaxID=3170016 RepID=A0ABV2A9B6_9GAMM
MHAPRYRRTLNGTPTPRTVTPCSPHRRVVSGVCTFGVDGDYGGHDYAGFCDKGNGNHHISPRDVVYLLRANDGSTWKLRILSYYDADTGESGFPIFEYAPVTP